MAKIDDILVHFKTLNTFNTRNNVGDIQDKNLVFIKDKNRIYTHGQTYQCAPVPSTVGTILGIDSSGNLYWAEPKSILETSLTDYVKKTDLVGNYLPASTANKIIDEDNTWHVPRRISVGSYDSGTCFLYFKNTGVRDNVYWTASPHIELNGPRLGFYGNSRWYFCAAADPSYGQGVFLDTEWVGVGSQTPGAPRQALNVTGSAKIINGNLYMPTGLNGICFSTSASSSNTMVAQFNSNGTNGFAIRNEGQAVLLSNWTEKSMKPSSAYNNAITLGISTCYWKAVYAAAHTTVSDERVKNFIEDMPLIPLDTMADAPCMTFTWKTGDKSKTYGTKAQYWQKVNEDLVEVGDNGIQTLQYGNLAFAMGKSLANEVRELRKENAELKSEINKIKKYLNIE